MLTLKNFPAKFGGDVKVGDLVAVVSRVDSSDVITRDDLSVPVEAHIGTLKKYEEINGEESYTLQNAIRLDLKNGVYEVNIVGYEVIGKRAHSINDRLNDEGLLAIAKLGADVCKHLGIITVNNKFEVYKLPSNH